MTLDVQVLVIAFLNLSLRLVAAKTALDADRTKDSGDANRPQAQAGTQRSDGQTHFSAALDSNADN
jgi:hypothetical protein